MVTFSVDTHLFRELGELLVGRDSTALLELIKNSYDADATKVVVYGEGLSSPSRGYIRIQDNGVGMSLEEFRTGFLTIAARTKNTEKRRSAVLNRRFTGAKGIGRLAAHKLARVLEVVSTRWDGSKSTKNHPSLRLSGVPESVEATIDWDRIESKKTLDEVGATDAIALRTVRTGAIGAAGTTITMRKLRRAWTKSAHSRFLEEIQAFEPPKALLAPIPKRVVPEKLLFQEPTVRDVADSNGQRFEVHLEGELAPPDDYWVAVVDAANWIIEIDASRSSGRVRYKIAPTLSTRRDLSDAVVRDFDIPHPSPNEGPFFQARIFKRTGVQRGNSDLKEWAGRSSGVRVFMEGFRILPYGEARNDWLSLDRDYALRDRNFLNRSIEDDLDTQLEDAERKLDGLVHLPNRNYVGGVFLTERNASTLRMLVNREGFVPDASYDTLVELVRKGLDLSTRVQAAASQQIRTARRELRAEKRTSSGDDNSEQLPTAAAIQATVRDAQEHAQRAKRLVASGRIEDASKELLSGVLQVQKVAGASNEIAEEAAMMRVLASVGTQLASFVHEVNGLLEMANSVDIALSRIRKSAGLSASHKKDLAILNRSIADLRRTLERQASYLTDVVTPDSRRRRSRLEFSGRLESSIRLIAFATEKRQIKIQNKLPLDLRSPPMFPAELTALFSNLLTNAVKAAGHKGRIQIAGKRERDGAIKIRVENTGARVNLREAERWFRPFESSTTEVDPVLGQGMGLGLPITRSMLEEYGATIRFVAPSGGFSTALEITFPE